MLPSQRALLLCAGVAVIALIAAFDPRWLPAWQGALALLCGFLLIDLLIGLASPPPRVRRIVASSLPLGVEATVTLRIDNRRPATLRARVYDHHPPQMHTSDLPQSLTLAARRWSELHYRITPTRRGDCQFPCTQLRYQSPLGLWWRDRRIGNSDTVRVYPNFATVAKYTLLASADRAQQMGIRKRRRRGQGSEFHQLREFRDGDSLRQVDWRATARLQKLISREYQDERDQNIVMLLDCGRRMRSQDVELSHFDHALNAMLLLSYVALRQGDAVGVATFGGSQRWLKPIRGQGMLNNLLNAVYDLEPAAEAPDYSRAAVELMARQRKRSLVVVLTGLRDEAGDDLLPALKLLQRRHTVLLASLREQAIDELLQHDIGGLQDAVTHAATHHYLQQRQHGLDWLVKNGITSVDVAPKKLSVALVNHYLAMKAGGRI